MTSDKGHLALVIELHHPLPGPGGEAGRDWASASVETYWPLLRALVAVADAGLAEVATVAVSPSWTALAADPIAQAMTRAELDRRADMDDGYGEAGRWRALRQFVVD